MTYCRVPASGMLWWTAEVDKTHDPLARMSVTFTESHGQTHKIHRCIGIQQHPFYFNEKPLKPFKAADWRGCSWPMLPQQNMASPLGFPPVFVKKTKLVLFGVCPEVPSLWSAPSLTKAGPGLAVRYRWAGIRRPCRWANVFSIASPLHKPPKRGPSRAL